MKSQTVARPVKLRASLTPAGSPLHAAAIRRIRARLLAAEKDARLSAIRRHMAELETEERRVFHGRPPAG